MRLDANETWFNFTSQYDDFSVYAFSGYEEVCKPYEFTVELVSHSADVDVVGLLGTAACLSIADRSGEKRLVHGIIREMEQLHTANYFTHYRAVLVPRLWFLEQIVDHRIFQNLTVADIIEKILKEQNFAAESYKLYVSAKMKEREYCVQYGETDLHFITRICEEEGIFFYFTHTEHSHTIQFRDITGGHNIAGETEIRFYPGSGHIADKAVISRLALHHQVNSDTAAYKEWNFTTPHVDLFASRQEPDIKKAPTPGAMKLEQYRYPHLYQIDDEGERYAKLQLARQLTFTRWIECESDVCRFAPGHKFSIKQHQRRDVNSGWWVASVKHDGKQPGVLEHESPDDRGLEYKASLTAIPDSTRFVPKLEHPKNRMDGLQSAIVTGPGNEEVYTDKYGRVKVLFHWDRLGSHDDNSSCWVRVADSWAGSNFGFIQIPRVGQEVLVEFMEGNPDRPVITGRVYNESLMPPWNLPEQKTLSGIQSREFKSSGRNQLVLDDTQGEIQAQLSSDHGLSQLNIGYLTRVNHVQGRNDFRGEGFELRTDNWGAIRAAQGLLITTDSRSNAQAHHKDMSELTENLYLAEKRHLGRTNLAMKCDAYEAEEQDHVSQILKTQNKQISGAGQPHKELEAAHIVLSSPAGIATSTPESMHIYTGNSLAATTDAHFSLTSGKSILGVAIEKIRLFAYKTGIKIFAAQGKVEIQAQSDDLDLIADKVLRLISAQERVHISAPKEILLTAGDSYIKIDASGIESGTDGRFIAYSSNHNFVGPKSKTALKVAFNNAKPVCEVCENLKNPKQ